VSTLEIGDRVRPLGEFAEAIGQASEGVVIDVDTTSYDGEVVRVWWSGRGPIWVGVSMLEKDGTWRPPEGFELFDPGSAAWEEHQRGGAVEVVTYRRTDQDFVTEYGRPITIPMQQNEQGVWVADHG
jgi:hypothetical protein